MDVAGFASEWNREPQSNSFGELDDPSSMSRDVIQCIQIAQRNVAIFHFLQSSALMASLKVR